MSKSVLFIINIFDYFHKKKILKFLKKNLKLTKLEFLVDIGAHHGESINFFCSNFDVSKIISVEASPKNFKILGLKIEQIRKKFFNTKISIINLTLGDENKLVFLKEFNESSSSTIKQIDENSSYYKKKVKILNPFKNTEVYQEIEVSMTKLSDFFLNEKISKVDFLKIDTEGSEFNILKGLGREISDVKVIYFEHHYDLMIKKDYKFRDINNLLLMNNFRKVFKIKMPFRKVFEYIYINQKK